MTLQDPTMSPEIANLDLSKIAALQQKRTLAFVNHFLITTVQFLNNFMKHCEEKLMHFERKLEKVNASLVLLEAKLSSIPEVNPSTESLKDTVKQSNLETKTSSHVEEQIENVNVQETPTIEETDSPKIKPEYEKFVKMVQVGVPLEAVKLKVSLEGLEPLVLEQIIKK